MVRITIVFVSLLLILSKLTEFAILILTVCGEDHVSNKLIDKIV